MKSKPSFASSQGRKSPGSRSRVATTRNSSMTQGVTLTFENWELFRVELLPLATASPM